MRFLRTLVVLTLIAGVFLATGLTPAPTLAAPISLTNCTQAGLEQAINDAATTDPNNPGLVTFNCPNPTITFTTVITLAGDPQTTAVTIDGSNNDTPIILDGNNATSFFRVDTGVYLTLQHLTMQNGNQTDGTEGGAIDSDGAATVNIIDTTFNSNVVEGFGGAIDNTEGTLTISQSTFDNNQGAIGGAINNFLGTVIVNQSTFTSNSAHSGGAISNLNDGNLTISRSIFTANSANFGGAIYNEYDDINSVPALLTINQSTFTSNSAEHDGGAIENYGDLTVQRSSFINNHSQNIGGAIDAWRGPVTIIASTMSGNTADGILQEGTGSAVFINEFADEVLIVGSTIVQPENTTPALYIYDNDILTLEGVILGGPGDHCAFNNGDLTDTYTLANDDSCNLSAPTSQQNIPDLLLGPLTTIPVNGVDQTYYPLLEGSPAIDAGPIGCETDIIDGPDTDQLGTPRPTNDNCDIGAIEGIILYPATLCANRWNGALRMTDTCSRSETTLTIPQFPWPTLCVNNWNNTTRLSQDCTRSEHPITITGDRTIPICINRWSHTIRATTNCTRSETQHWL